MNNTFADLDLTRIPKHMRGGLIRYLEEGIKPGSFLTAVLENKLVEAYSRADSINTECMREWVELLYNELPLEAWGSPEKVTKWMNQRRNK